MIVLTNSSDDCRIRVNPDHIVAYWWNDEHSVSEVITSNEGFDISLKVKETADRIDYLMLAAS